MTTDEIAAMPMAEDGYWITPDGTPLSVDDSSHSTLIAKLLRDLHGTTSGYGYDEGYDEGYVRVSFFAHSGAVSFNNNASVEALKTTVALIRDPRWNRGRDYTQSENRSLGYKGFTDDVGKSEIASKLMRIVLEKSSAAKAAARTAEALTRAEEERVLEPA